MKVVHICLCGPYTDGWNYQENLLTKYQKFNGNDVSIITSQWQYNNQGKLELNGGSNCYIYEGIKIHRIELVRGTINSHFKKYRELYGCIESERPEFIFVHGLQFLDLKTIIKYVKKNNIPLVIDNHADFSNSATTLISRCFLHKIIWKRLARKAIPYTKMFYGVLPARVDFLEKMYSIPSDKIKLLLMGADDERISYCLKNNSRNRVRIENNIDDKEFLIVTGGKFDLYKKQVINLMKVVNNLKYQNVKLLIFGSIDSNLQIEFNNNLSDRITYVGWASSSESYSYFSAADLIAFPGRHSVFWEQAIGQGIPVVAKKWDGTTHINIGGNAILLEDDSYGKWESSILSVLDMNNYQKMKKAAENAKQFFLYSKIAKESLEI